MSNPDVSSEILEAHRQKTSSELLRLHTELDAIGYLVPQTLTAEKSKAIQDTLSGLAKEAEDMDQKPMAEVLRQLEIQFYSLQTIGTIDNLDKFQMEAGYALDKLETVLLMIPSTSEAVLERIAQRRSEM